MRVTTKKLKAATSRADPLINYLDSVLIFTTAKVSFFRQLKYNKDVIPSANREAVHTNQILLWTSEHPPEHKHSAV